MTRTEDRLTDALTAVATIPSSPVPARPEGSGPLKFKVPPTWVPSGLPGSDAVVCRKTVADTVTFEPLTA